MNMDYGNVRLSYHLQRFAKDGPGGEKTEPATAKKLNDARKEGQVAKSKEVGNFLGLLSLFLVLKIWAGSMGLKLMSSFSTVYDRIPDLVELENGLIIPRDYASLINHYIVAMLGIMLPVLAIGTLVAFVGDLVQVKWKPTSKPMQPKFSKMNPVKGLKKIISPNSLVELLKSFLKIGVIGYLVYTTLQDKLNMLMLLYDVPLLQAVLEIGELVIDLGLKISLLYIVIAAADFIYQKWKFKEDMKMSKQEVKEEFKNAEGDPLIKSKIRQKMMEASRRRMMQALPEADVVITNPTHFAVAIKYDPQEADAPLVLAKGEDYLAQKIKEKAREYHVEIVENKPLARMLYANVEVGEQVPPELYQAVAEVLAFVYNLQGRV